VKSNLTTSLANWFTASTEMARYCQFDLHRKSRT